MQEKKNRIIPFFIAHQGCPHACVFCNQKKITGQTGKLPDAAEIRNQIYAALTLAPSSEKAEVAFYGGSFTGLSPTEQIALLKPVYQCLQAGLIGGIRVSTRPDLIDTQQLKRLIHFGVKTIELGIQSMDAQVLIAANRGYSPQVVPKAVELIQNENLNLGLQMMLGLPHDTWKSTWKTAQKLIALKPDFVRIYPAVILKDTPLHQLYQSEIYQPLPLDQAITWCRELYLAFLSAHIPVIRMGLHPTECLLTPGEIIAGPFHPAFGDLVQGEVALKQVEWLLRQWFKPNKNTEFAAAITTNKPELSLTLWCNPKYRSKINGQKKKNLYQLKDNWGITLKIKHLSSLPTQDLILQGEFSKNSLYFSWRRYLTAIRHKNAKYFPIRNYKL